MSLNIFRTCPHGLTGFCILCQNNMPGTGPRPLPPKDWAWAAKQERDNPYDKDRLLCECGSLVDDSRYCPSCKIKLTSFTHMLKEFDNINSVNGLKKAIKEMENRNLDNQFGANVTYRHLHKKLSKMSK